MFDKFGDYMYSLLIAPLKKTGQSANQFYIFFKVIGTLFDQTKEDIFRLREESMIISASARMLAEHGKDRGMARLDGESVEGFRTRLAMKAIIAEKAGTNEGILLAVAALGYRETFIRPRWETNPERWAEAVLFINCGGNDAMRDKRRIMSEVNLVKPASALIVPNFYEVIAVRNRNRLVFRSLSMHTRMNNFLTAPVLLDGRYTLEGLWWLDQRITDHFHARSMKIHSAKQLENQLVACSALAVSAKEATGIHTALEIKVSLGNVLTNPVLLNGKHPLDGSWILNQCTTERFHIRSATIHTAEHQSSRLNPRFLLAASKKERSGSKSASVARTAAQSEKNLSARGQTQLTGARNKNASSALLVTDTMWRLDGEHHLGGSRHLNAAVLTEKI